MTRKKIISKLIWSNISSSIGCIIRCGCVCVVNLYFEFYIFQDIPVKLWNCWKRSKNLTNNGHEGYNGRLKRKIKAPHPNPNKLLCFLKKELALSELCARHYENGGDPPYTAKKYRDLERTKVNLKDRLRKHQIPILSYVKNIGGISMKVML